MSIDFQKSMAKTRVKFPEIPWRKVTDVYGSVLAISKLTPMKSAAGWYIGRFCTEMSKNGDPTCLEPYSRDSGYYPNKEMAVKYES